MIEILPIRLLTDDDSLIFGSLNVALAKLKRAGVIVVEGLAVAPPEFKLQTVIEHFDFGTKEIFEQYFTLIKKEIEKTPIPQNLLKEVGKHKWFFISGEQVKSVKNLWLTLLSIWLDQIKGRIWNSGFFKGVTENLDPKVVIFLKKLEGFGTAYFDPIQDDVQIQVKSGKLKPAELKQIAETVAVANKKLFMTHEYEWVIDRGVKLAGLKPYTPSVILNTSTSLSVGSAKRSEVFDSEGRALRAQTRRESPTNVLHPQDDRKHSAVKVLFDLSAGLTIEKNIDGVYIASEKIFNLDKPRESFEDLVFRLVESAITFSELPIFLKLADKSEGMGKIRGSLRLLHQKSLLEPILEALDFARHKKGLINIHVVIPFVRGVNELLQIKRELATKKLMRKNSLEIWLEIAVLENMVHLEDYITSGIDGVVLNLDELIAHFNGFDLLEGELAFYKNEVDGLLKFLEDGIRLLHKLNTPFIAFGNLTFYPKVLEFLVEKGVHGVVVDRYEAHSAHELLYQMEKRILLRKC